MDIKKFFKKKKFELKFKKAGPGQRLNEEAPTSSSSSEQRSHEPCNPRTEMSEEAKQAAAAAMARLQQTSVSTGFTSSSLYYKRDQGELRRELNCEPNPSTVKQKSAERQRVEKEIQLSQLAADGVYFRCHLLGPEILTKSEWRAKIKTYLYEQLATEKGLTACLIIRNCNSNVDKVNICTETLCKYLQNILNNPVEEKYKKIRLSNKVFQEKVKGIEGAIEFLEAAGFSKEHLSVQNGIEDFLYFSVERIIDIEYLRVLIEALENAERIELELDRNIQILLPTQAENRTKLPDEFYRFTPDELKKEYQARQESLENSLALRTKAMREKQEMKEMKKYKYALIRVRFPDGIFLQGTFSVYEKYEEVVKLVEENVAVRAEFSLLVPDIGKTFTPDDYGKTLMELRLVPATVLIFRLNQPIDEGKVSSYLKPDIALLMQNL